MRKAYTTVHMKKKTKAKRVKPVKGRRGKAVARAKRVTKGSSVKKKNIKKKKPIHRPVRTPAEKAVKLEKGPRASLYPYDVRRHGDVAWHLSQFERLLKKYGSEDQDVLRRALAFAKERHEKQVRKDGSPYIIHPVRIANIIASEWGVRETPLIAAALLHDVIEDTQTTIREVKDEFGEGIGKLVDGMTMWPGSETPEVYLKRVSRGPRELRIVKCADMLDNLRSWPDCHDDVTDRYSRWWRQAHDYALPMAEDTLDAAAKRIREIVEDSWYLRRANMI
jgi:hypothetical protein